MPRFEPFNFSGTVPCDRQLINEQKIFPESVGA